MYKRAFFLGAIFAVSAGTTFFLLKPNPKKQTERAFVLFQQNNLQAAEAIIKTSPSVPLCQRFLLRGYLEQVRSRTNASEQLLQTAYNEAKKGDHPELLQEILLARAANAYIEKKDEDFAAFLGAAQELSMEGCAPLIFLEGLHCYLQQDYVEALRHWNSTLTHSEARTWLELALDKLFSPQWKKLHSAHCLIEIGEIHRGREILEKESHALSCEQEHQQLAVLFLGLSYLKEAQNVPFEQRSSYYTMARFYFEHTQIGSLFSREKSNIMTYLEEEVKKLLLADAEKSLWGLECMHTLQAWNAKEPLERIAEALAKKMIKEEDPSFAMICEELCGQFQSTAFHIQLSEKMLAALAQALKRGSSDELFRLWEIVESLAPNPKKAAKEIASLTTEEIFEKIKKDNMQLGSTRAYLVFWEKLGRSPEEKERLAQDLFYQSKLFWHNEQQEKKGVRLMEVALSLSPDRLSLEKDITAFLTALYTRAENSNMIRRMTLIYEAMEHFDINRQELVTKATLANHLADSQYLYEVHNYPSAKMHANWVLKLDPQNETARLLAGLCSFHLGEYSKALCYLKSLKNPNEDACKALMLSQILSSQEQSKELCQIDFPNTFEEND